MAELWDAGVRGASLDVVAAWKDVLLAAALVVAMLGARPLPLAALGRPARARLRRDRRPLLAAAAELARTARRPQRGQLFAARHDLIPVAAYFLGRLLVLTPRDVAARLARARRRRGRGDRLGARRRLPRAAAVVARLRRAGLVRGAARARLQRGLSGLPENWVLNTGDEQNPIRRLVSTFLSPLADRVRARDRPALPRRPAADRVDGRRRRQSRTPGCSGRTRGRLPRPRARARRARRRRSAGCFPSRSRRHRSSSASGSSRRSRRSGRRRATRRRSSRSCAQQGQAEPRRRRRPARARATPRRRATCATFATGSATVVRHPQGFGLGNAGVSASRTGVEIKAGESTYTELGVDTGSSGSSRSSPGWSPSSPASGGARPGSAPPGLRCSRSASRPT